MSTPQDIANTLAIAHLVNTLRRAQRGFWQWENGYPFDTHGEPRSIQCDIDDALRPYDELDRLACGVTYRKAPGEQ